MYIFWPADPHPKTTVAYNPVGISNEILDDNSKVANKIKDSNLY